MNSDSLPCKGLWVTVMTGLPGDHSKREPPDPIPNSEVKTLRADDSMGSPHVKVGHRQAIHYKALPHSHGAGLFYAGYAGYSGLR